MSGQVLLPKGVMPRGGWPLVAWAHGTTGLADQCAPSLAPELGHDASAVREVRALLAHGYAVVASDYPGLGTPGVHTYLIGAANGTAVVDAVAAAHRLLPTALTPSWTLVGHSEGGQAALFTAAVAEDRASRGALLGTVALAPASSLDLLVPLAQTTADPVDQAYALYAVAGLAAVDPTVSLSAIVAPAGRRFLPDLTRGCIDDVTHDLAAHPTPTLFAVSPELMMRIDGELDHYDDPNHARWSTPTLIVQGTKDTDVPVPVTDTLVTALCAERVPVEYTHYPGLDHEQVVPASFAEVDAWLRARFAGRRAPSNCAAGGSSNA